MLLERIRKGVHKFEEECVFFYNFQIIRRIELDLKIELKEKAHKPGS